MDLPKISIVTPSYNQGQFLEETILSVLDQEYPNLEYMIIDGGSTDNSVEIIKKYSDKLAYWVSEPDEGQSDAINKGFRMATGEILGWINSDDSYVPGAIRTVADFFENNKDVFCVYGDIHMIDANGRTLYTVKSIRYEYRMLLHTACLIPQPGSFFRKEVFDTVGYLDTKLQYNMDVEFFVRLGKNNIKFANIRTPLACFRLHAQSKTISEYDKEVQLCTRIIKDRYRKSLFSKHKVLDDCWLSLLRWFYRFKALTIRAFTRGQFFPFQSTFFRRVIREKY